MNFETLSINNPVARMYNTKAVQNAPITSEELGFVDVSELEEQYFNEPTHANWLKWFTASFNEIF